MTVSRLAVVSSLAAVIIGGSVGFVARAEPITDCWPDIPPPPTAPTQIKAPLPPVSAPDETLA